MSLKLILKRAKIFFFTKGNRSIELIKNINIEPENQLQHKVLISYLCSTFEIDFDKNIDRTYYFEINEILKSFASKGYCIDIVNCNATEKINYIKDTRYNVIFGYGEVFYQMTQLQPLAKSILYMTENHPNFSTQEEEKRKKYYWERHRRYVKQTRSGLFYKSEHLEKIYNHIIVLGEIEHFKKTYEQIYTIFPTGLSNKDYKYTDKNHSITRTRYLWFGSGGAVHKGLDLLIDIFKDNKNIELLICGLNEIEQDFLKIPKQPNIQILGRVNVQSDAFLNIVSKCTFVILPSCSEAMSTSITTCMLHGLIPIVMRDSGFNRLGENAIFLDSYKIEDIKNALEKLSLTTIDELEILRKKVYDFAKENFILSNFNKQINIILHTILK